jgi:hypothetical protein
MQVVKEFDLDDYREFPDRMFYGWTNDGARVLPVCLPILAATSTAVIAAWKAAVGDQLSRDSPLCTIGDDADDPDKEVYSFGDMVREEEGEFYLAAILATELNVPIAPGRVVALVVRKEAYLAEVKNWAPAELAAFCAHHSYDLDPAQLVTVSCTMPDGTTRVSQCAQSDTIVDLAARLAEEDHCPPYMPGVLAPTGGGFIKFGDHSRRQTFSKWCVKSSRFFTNTHPCVSPGC